jgi:hypothetical protein
VDSKFCSTWGGWSSNEVHGFYGVGLRISGGARVSSLYTLDLRLMMALKLDFGMMCDVRIRPLRQFF